MSNVREVTDATWETDVLGSDKPVVVDFWAAWCGPCRMVAPEIEKLAEKYAGTVEVRKLDVDANPQTAMKYGIMSIPTVAMFQQGQAPRAAVGLRPREALEQAINQEAVAPKGYPGRHTDGAAPRHVREAALFMPVRSHAGCGILHRACVVRTARAPRSSGGS